MEFLVRTETYLPADLDDDRRDALRAAERTRADELRDAGLLLRLWRVPGRAATVQLWAAPDATVLHDALSSLPMWKWMRVDVEALATHPQEANRG